MTETYSTSTENSTCVNYEFLIANLKTEYFKGKEIIGALVSLMEQISGEIETYDTILSDETGARLISLVFRKVIDEVRIVKERTPVSTYFLATGQDVGTTELMSIHNFLAKKKKGISRALVVTEYMYSGQSLQYLGEILNGLETDFTIISLATDLKPEDYRTGELIHTPIYSGKSESRILVTRSSRKYTGVKKKESRQSPHPIIDSTLDMQIITDARHDVDLISKELIKLIPNK